ncbi:MAG: HigA family addiction module antitoxin [Corynebacterium glucuronolyticum]|nr:HigA family addiction module antitoxin [Corynebacterium glucuronolyticum]MDD7585458.1 HigA family addiction module antitoxin [Mycobacteriaceae bacterium]MDY5835206.1 HigA family addiction module antitoxin [Corynebacterium glucuronolyticum]
MTTNSELLAPIHPGTIFMEEFMAPLELSQNYLARSINVPPRRINEIVLGKRAITIDTALRLARFFGNSSQFWMNLQNCYDEQVTLDEIGDDLKKITPLNGA